MTDATGFYEAPRDPSVPVRVRGVGRVADEPRAVMVLLTDRPTDDELRTIHERLRTPSVSPSAEAREQLVQGLCAMGVTQRVDLSALCDAIAIIDSPPPPPDLVEIEMGLMNGGEIEALKGLPTWAQRLVRDLVRRIADDRATFFPARRKMAEWQKEAVHEATQAYYRVLQETTDPYRAMEAALRAALPLIEVTAFMRSELYGALAERDEALETPEATTILLCACANEGKDGAGHAK